MTKLFSYFSMNNEIKIFNYTNFESEELNINTKLYILYALTIVENYKEIFNTKKEQINN